MSRVPVYVLSIAAASAAFVSSAYGQAVISTRAGVVHFFEGAVYIAGQRLEARLGKFASVPEGAELRTEYGRAEVLLTPGVFLRVGEKSAIRMIANALSDTRVEVLAGSAIVETAEPTAGTSVTVIYKDWKVSQPQRGIYRVDCEPPQLAVLNGEATVAATGGAPVSVREGMNLPFAGVLVPEKSTDDAPDTLSDWAAGRAQSISTDNSIAANIQDPASMTGSSLPADAFTYFPMLGYSGYGSGLSPLYGPVSGYNLGVYGPAGIYPSGFSSLYLPVYTYRPSSLGLPSLGSPRPLYPPSRIGTPGLTLPRPPVATPRPVTPLAPHPAVIHH